MAVRPCWPPARIATSLGYVWTDYGALGRVGGYLSQGHYGIQRIPSGLAVVHGTTVGQTDAAG